MSVLCLHAGAHLFQLCQGQGCVPVRSRRTFKLFGLSECDVSGLGADGLAYPKSAPLFEMRISWIACLYCHAAVLYLTKKVFHVTVNKLIC